MTSQNQPCYIHYLLLEIMKNDDIVNGMGQDFFHSAVTGDENNLYQIIHSVSESDNPVLIHNFLCVLADGVDQFCEYLVDERTSNGDVIKKLMDRIKWWKLNGEDDLG